MGGNRAVLATWRRIACLDVVESEEGVSSGTARCQMGRAALAGHFELGKASAGWLQVGRGQTWRGSVHDSSPRLLHLQP